MAQKRATKGDRQVIAAMANARVEWSATSPDRTQDPLATTRLPDGLGLDIQAWKSISGTASPDAWFFPSEKISTPAGKDNVWRRHIVPKLKTVGLEWISFQVMRRTHSSLMNEFN